MGLEYFVGFVVGSFFGTILCISTSFAGCIVFVWHAKHGVTIKESHRKETQHGKLYSCGSKNS